VSSNYPAPSAYWQARSASQDITRTPAVTLPTTTAIYINGSQARLHLDGRVTAFSFPPRHGIGFQFNRSSNPTTSVRNRPPLSSPRRRHALQPSGSYHPNPTYALLLGDLECDEFRRLVDSPTTAAPTSVFLAVRRHSPASRRLPVVAFPSMAMGDWNRDGVPGSRWPITIPRRARSLLGMGD